MASSILSSRPRRKGVHYHPKGTPNCPPRRARSPQYEHCSVLTSDSDEEDVGRAKEDLKGHAQQAEPCRFLDLPPELRNQIYHLALGPREVAEFGKLRQGWPSPPEYSPVKDLAALVRTCKQIYAEANPVMYGGVKFEFNDFNALRWWLRDHARMRKHLPHLRVTRKGPQWNARWNTLLNTQSGTKAVRASVGLLAEATSLQELELGRSAYQCDSSYEIAVALRPLMVGLIKYKGPVEPHEVLSIVQCVDDLSCCCILCQREKDNDKAAADQMTIEIRADLKTLLGIE